MTGGGKLPKFAADMFHLEGTDLGSRHLGNELTAFTATRRSTRTAAERVCAWTACFRSEAGAAGKDTRGIKRQHQFQKVELFKFTRPEQSYDELESLVRNAEAGAAEAGAALSRGAAVHGRHGIRVGEDVRHRGVAAVAKEFMEISSCSNTEAFQARRSGIRFKPKGGKTEFVHTLNGSGLAVGRTWIAVVEN